MMDQFTVFNGWLLLRLRDGGRNEIMCLLEAQE